MRNRARAPDVFSAIRRHQRDRDAAIVAALIVLASIVACYDLLLLAVSTH